MNKSILILCFVVVCILWFGQLANGLWIDELQTYWVINGSLSDCYHRAIQTQGFSPLYFCLLWLWTSVAGTSEIALRFPSTAFSLIAGWYLYKLCLLYSDKELALISVLMFFLCDEVVGASINARPYALGICGAVASVYYLHRWMEALETNAEDKKNIQYMLYGDKAEYLFGYIVSSLLTFYSHFFFSSIFLIHFVFLISRRERLPIFNVSIVWFVILLGCIPATAQISLFASKVHLVRGTGADSVTDLLTALLSPLTVPFVLMVLGLSFGHKDTRFARPNPVSFVFSREKLWILAWYFVPPITLFALSHIVLSSFLIDRYYSVFTPGLSMLIAHLLYAVEPPRIRKAVLISVVLLFIFIEPIKSRLNEDWEAALSSIDKKGAPILIYSGIAQSQNLDLYDQFRQSGFLSSPVSYYASSLTAIPVPFLIDNMTGGQFLKSKILPELREHKKVLLVVNNINYVITSSGEKTDVKDLIEAQVLDLGFTEIRHEQFSRIHVYHLEKKETSFDVSKIQGTKTRKENTDYRMPHILCC